MTRFFSSIFLSLVLFFSMLVAPVSAVSCNEGTLSFEQPLELGKEYPIPNEEATTKAILNGLQKQMMDKEAVRNQHPKAHGIVKAQFTVESTIPKSYQIGLFKDAKTYDALIRFSNGKEQVSDLNPDVRGMAIKLTDVPGKKILDEKDSQDQQDFVLMNSPVFFADSLTTLARFTKDPTTTPCARQILGETMKNGAMIASPVDALYWSTTPYKLGDYAVKYSVEPQNKTPFNPSLAKSEDYLSEALTAKLSKQDVYFDFFVQVQTDPVAMPVEDATVEWDESVSPPIKFATIKITQQVIDRNSPENKQLDIDLAFTPWHSLPEHRPLGNINRARKEIYQVLSKFRQKQAEMAMNDYTK